MAKKIHVPGYSSFGPHHVVEYRGKEYIVPMGASDREVASAIDEAIASELMVELLSFAVLATVTLVNAGVKAVKKEYERYQIKKFSQRPRQRTQRFGTKIGDKWQPLSNT